MSEAHVVTDGPIDPIAARRKLESAGTMHWMHWIVVSLSLGLTFFAWYFSKSEADARIQAQFDREADQVVELILERMQKYEDALWGGVAMTRTLDGEVDYDRWLEYSESLNIENKYPGLSGIGVIFAMSADAVPEFLDVQRRRRPDFSIYPEHDGDEFFPITYIEPVADNYKAVGLDMAHEANRFTAAKKARDTGVAQVTGPIVLVQDSAKTPGFLFYAPFYRGGVYDQLEERRQAFEGMVYAPFIVKNLMEGVLEKDKRHVGIRLTDGDDLLYDEHVATEQDFDPYPLFKRTINVPLYGRTWKFDIWSANSFRSAASNAQPLTILIGGLLIDGLLIGLFVTISRSSKIALRYADSMTMQLEENNSHLEAEVAERRRAEQEIIESNRVLRESQIKLRGLVDQSFNFVGLLTVDGVLLEANRTALEAAGVSESDVLGRPFWNTVWWTHSPEHQTRLRQAVRAAADGQTDRFEATHLAADGSEIFMDVSIKPVRDETGNVAFLIPEGRDVSAQRQREAKVNKLNEELVNSNQELEQFAYVASHDLQEPLRKISSYGQLLREECGDKIGEDGNEYLDVVIDSAVRLKNLVGDLLAFSRITTRGKELAPTAACECLQIAVDNLEVAIEECGGVVTWDALPSVVADNGQLILLFQNLIGNAIKYRDKSRPEIHIGGRDLGEQYEFYVRDNGIGIASEFYDRVFEIFQRLHNRREYSGTGIGLAICKRIVDRFGGRIWVESVEGEGSTFYFTIDKVIAEGNLDAHSRGIEPVCAAH